MEVQNPERLKSLFLNDAASKPVLLIGAGASQKSGIPLSDGIVEMAARWAYCESTGNHPENPNVKRSDWLRWLQQHAWYRRDASAADNYSAVIQNLLKPRESRREFFLRLIKPNVPPSRGYEDLLQLLDQRRIDTVLTTNFDKVLPELQVTRRRPHHLELIQTDIDHTKFSASPTYPQIIYLHGSVEHYSDRNLLTEVQRLDEGLVSLLWPLLRDHPLVVVGYRGAEPSVMQHLLADQATRTNGFRRGIFWCVLGDAVVHPSVIDLHARLAGNLQFVVIKGFDELMATLAQSCSALPTRTVTTSHSVADDSTVTFDMRVIPGARLEELDWPRIQMQVVEYCRNMQIEIPPAVTRPWLEERMEALDLLRRTAEGLRPTNAGYLLFGTDPGRHVKGAHCMVRIQNDDERRIEGHLWRQLDAITELFADFNQPFRLKSAISESVTPYPTLALKELLVNALVHRSYESGEPLKLDLDDRFIRLVNSGGLVPAVFDLVNTKLQEIIATGARGIRGYRNPVIADLFYGAGAMDKQGSGLPDVHAQVQRNEGKVFFGPIDEANESFRALIYRRDAVVDTTTKTAPVSVAKARYFGNLLELINVPATVWRAPTTCPNGRDVFELSKTDSPPVFALKRGSELLSFSDLSDANNPLRAAIDVARVARIATGTLAADPDGRRNIVELFNRGLQRHVESKELVVEFRRKRCFFERTTEGAREVTYQASLRQATRTVTKPIVSKRTERVLYWQHEAITFGFEMFGSEWGLRMLPGYVFTKDGRQEYLHHLKIGALATRKAARDFTLQVYNHLVFWTWILARGGDSFVVDFGLDVRVAFRGALLSCEFASPTAADDELWPDTVRDEDARLAQLEEEVAASLEEDAVALETADAD